jgi:serine/threonine protein phosphatase 1
MVSLDDLFDPTADATILMDTHDIRKQIFYAIGDIHGRYDLVPQMIAEISKSHDPRYTATIVFLGDYIDRGPQSKETIDLLSVFQKTCPFGTGRIVCLKGNHDDYMNRLLNGSIGEEYLPIFIDSWRRLGGDATLESYGIDAHDYSAHRAADLVEAFRAAVPQTHKDFLSSLPTAFSSGPYFFSHAGLNPEHLITAQKEDELLWGKLDPRSMRDFTSSMDIVSIHGHYANQRGTAICVPETSPRVICVDTAAVVTGILTAVMLRPPHVYILILHLDF